MPIDCEVICQIRSNALRLSNLADNLTPRRELGFEAAEGSSFLLSHMRMHEYKLFQKVIAGQPESLEQSRLDSWCRLHQSVSPACASLSVRGCLG